MNPRRRPAIRAAAAATNLGNNTMANAFTKYSRLAACAAALLTAAVAPAMAQAPAAPVLVGPAPVPPDSDEQRIADLVTANRILAQHGVLDGFGHISVRSLKNPKHFYMARSRAPAIVSREDILEFDENSQPVGGTNRELYNERYIHGEIFRARPDVQAVAHSHSYEVLPFTVADVPLKALVHVGYFLGTKGAPKFDLEDVEGPRNGMLVITPTSGAALAKTLGKESIVLMRGHGFTAAGENIRDVVFKAVYTQISANIENEALELGTPLGMNEFEVMRTERVARQWELWVTNIKK